MGDGRVDEGKERGGGEVTGVTGGVGEGDGRGGGWVIGGGGERCG